MYGCERIIAFMLVVSVATVCHGEQEANTLGPGNHLDQVDCGTCHLSGRRVTAENAHLLTESQKRLCSVCHETAVRRSHRSGFQAKAAAPLVYPLNWKGEMVCSTCHLIHATPGKMLRGIRHGKDFCFVCHQPQFFRNLATGGVKVLLSGHEAATPALLQHELDGPSIDCLQCHSTLRGRYEVYVDPSLIARHPDDRPYDHPVGRPFSKNVELGLRKASNKGSILPLINGRLSCISCHKRDGKPHGKLLLPLKKEMLCRQCHEFTS